MKKRENGGWECDMGGSDQVDQSFVFSWGPYCHKARFSSSGRYGEGVVSRLGIQEVGDNA